MWKARDKELDRTVAIKIPRQAVTGDEQENFFREARAAAQLRHPNIVSVHEVGRDGDSLYIVSDFVRGATLGDWITGQQLTNREAAELCAKIADALHHAHEQGVVHRDLKPANILMDRDNQPHLMDFGLARRDAGEVTVTVDGQVLGTPAYMSPEQALGASHTADRRSDVYSLGVILFQLLTSELPFRGNARMLMKQVIDDEPPSPRKLNANVSKDLETITLKCLEKDRNRRYETADALSRDLKHYLKGEPVTARPPSVVYRFSKFWRRNKVAMLLVTAFVLTLIVLIVGLTVSNRLIAAERNEKASALEQAELHRKRELESFAKARTAITGILVRAAFGRGEWSQLPSEYRKLFAAEAIRYYQSLLQSSGDDPFARYQIAVGYRGLASLHNSLNDFDKAEKFARLSVSLLEKLASEDGVYRDGLAYSNFVLGSTLYHGPKRTTEAKDVLQKGISLYEQLVDEEPHSMQLRHELLLPYRELLAIHLKEQEWLELEVAIQRLLRIGSRNMRQMDRSSNVTSIYRQISEALAAAKVLEFAVTMWENAPATAGQEDSAQRVIIAACYWELARTTNNKTKYTVAEKVARDAIRLNPQEFAAYDLLSDIFIKQGKMEEAIAASRAALQINPEDPLAYYRLGYALRRTGQLNEAVAAFRKSLEFEHISWSKYHMSCALYDLGKYEEAIRILREVASIKAHDPDVLNKVAWVLATCPDTKLRDPKTSVELAEKLVKLKPTSGNAWNTFGIAQFRVGNWNATVEALHKSIELRRGGDGMDWLVLAMAEWHLGNKDAARTWYEKGAAWLENRRARNPLTAGFHEEAAELMGVRPQDAEAEPSETPATPPADDDLFGGQSTDTPSEFLTITFIPSASRRDAATCGRVSPRLA